MLGHRVMAPSTLGTFLRAFTFGHIRQLDRVLGETLRRAWALGAGPGSKALVMDLDSTICAVCGKAKHGAGYGYTRELGYHPLVATRAGTGEVLHVRMRKGGANTQRGARRFVEELVARVRRAGATGELFMRFDSGFWSNPTIAVLERLDVGYTMGVAMVKSVVSAVEGIDESAWTPIDYTPGGEAEVAECNYKGRRLIVRRTRLTGRQQTLWPQWRHFAFVTDLGGKAVDVDEFHRAHATVELAIRDLKEGAGLEHVPSGHFSPTRRGFCARCSPTISSAGPPCSVTSHLTTTSPWPGPCAPGSCRSRVVSSAGPGGRHCGHRSNGRGPMPSTAPSTSCAPCRPSPCSSHLPRPAHRRRSQDGADNRTDSRTLDDGRPVF